MTNPLITHMCLEMVAEASEAAANNHELALKSWAASLGSNKSTHRPKWSHLEIAALRVLAASCRSELGEKND